MMKQRLIHLARDVPQLASVILALNEWIFNVASQDDLEQHLLEMETDSQAAGVGENTTGPLRIVIQRVLLYEPAHTQGQGPSAVIADCAKLISKILLSPEVDGTAQSTVMKKNLEELLTMGRILVFQMKTSAGVQTTPTPEQVANGISTCILELLQRSSREKRAHERLLDSVLSGDAKRCASSGSFVPSIVNQDQADEILRRLDAEINALVSKSANGGYAKEHVGEVSKDDALDLLAKRDIMKKIVDMSGLAVELSLGARIQPHVQSLEAKNDLVKKIIGTSISLNGAQSSAKMIMKLRAETTTHRSDLDSRRTSISSKRKEITKRMDELRRELNELEIENQGLAAEQNNVVSELGLLENIAQGGIKCFENGMSSKVEFFGADREVRGIAEKMGELERAWICSFSSPGQTSLPSTTNPSIISAASLFPQKLEQYLSHVRSYFETEAQSVEFLCNRVSTTEAEILELESQLEACAGLGMPANVELMTHDLKTCQSHLNEDKLVIDSLKKNVEEMQSDLICRVQDYCRSDLGALTPSHAFFIEEISTHLNRIHSHIDLDDNEGLSSLKKLCPEPAEPASVKYGSSVNGSEAASAQEVLPPVVTKSNGETPPPLPVAMKSNGGTPPPILVVVPKPVPVVMPKFSWGKKTDDVPKKETKSFLDIQQEELLERNGSTKAN